MNMHSRKHLKTAISVTGMSSVMAVFLVYSPGCTSPGYVGTDTCLTCHTGKLAPDRRDFVGSRHEVVGCEACHGPGVLHARVGGRFGLFINEAENVDALCVRCHENESEQFSTSSHAMNKILDCTGCHNPHTKNKTIRPFTDNQLCLQCHSYNGFESVEAITKHTWHSYDPDGSGESRCSLCHMVPMDRADQEGSRNHSFMPVAPITSNLAEITPVPPNSCAGIIGCHDGTVVTAPTFNVDDPTTNEWLQTLYDSRYGS